MNSIQSDLSKLYPLGDKSLVPVGVDEERYSLRFLADSRRLFASQEEHLEVMRVLSESGGGISAANIVGLIKVTDSIRERILFGRKRQCTRQPYKGEAEKSSCDNEESVMNSYSQFTVLCRSIRAPPHRTHSSKRHILYYTEIHHS